MAEIAERILGHRPKALKDILGSGRDRIEIDRIGTDQATAHLGEEADVTPGLVLQQLLHFSFQIVHRRQHFLFQRNG